MHRIPSTTAVAAPATAHAVGSASTRRALRHRRTGAATCVLLLAALAAGCGDPDQGDSDPAASVQAPLPAPAAADGAVTGMPAGPGPGEVPLAGDAPPPPPPALLPADANFGLPPLEDNPEAGLSTPAAAQAVAAPAPADAAALLRDYYAAIDAGDHARAYAAWSDGGRASGQDPQRFAAALAGVVGVELTVGEPEPMQAAAGSRQVEIPVTVTTTRDDGSVQRQAGRYQLRIGTADGADAGQRAWRIVSADLRDAVSP